MTSSILLVDDEKNIRLMASTVLKKAGYHAVSVATAGEALDVMKETVFGLVLIDYMMPDMDGIVLTQHIRKQIDDPPPIVLMTAFGSIDTAVNAMKAGAVDYMAKPFTSDDLLHIVQRNLQTKCLEREVAELKDRLDSLNSVYRAGLIIESDVMKTLLKTAEQVARSNAPVLIEGETGTGKERLASFIHERSPRANRPLIAINCGALHPELFLSELFGHRRGAFTGAIEDRIGRFEAADGGTLFLDEIGEMDEGAQVKLLRVLQEGSFERLGEGKIIHTDVRIIAATNQPLEEMVSEGAFRSDLYYRLAVVPLRIPPLRDRIADIPPLANAFLEEFSADVGRADLKWSAKARQVLLNAPWHGNIREMRNVVQRAVLLASPDARQIELNDFAAKQATNAGKFSTTSLDAAISEQWSFERLEAEYLKHLSRQSGLTNADICRILQIDASTLWRKRKKYGLA